VTYLLTVHLPDKLHPNTWPAIYSAMGEMKFSTPGRPGQEVRGSKTNSYTTYFGFSPYSEEKLIAYVKEKLRMHGLPVLEVEAVKIGQGLHPVKP
jgi:hypothetical protein